VVGLLSYPLSTSVLYTLYTLDSGPAVLSFVLYLLDPVTTFEV
jgi:hypothetical protein